MGQVMWSNGLSTYGSKTGGEVVLSPGVEEPKDRGTIMMADQCRVRAMGLNLRILDKHSNVGEAMSSICILRMMYIVRGGAIVTLLECACTA